MSQSAIKKSKKLKRASTGLSVREKFAARFATKKAKQGDSDRTQATVARRASDSALMPPPASRPLPVVKKARTEGGFTGAMSAPPRARVPFEVRARPGLGAMTKVKLLPHLRAKDGAVAGLAFGRGRTPSPFGNKMGDHTGSWTSVVDAVHARIFGKGVDDAVAELERMQAKAQEWMAEDASPGMKVWDMLSPEDQEARRAVLENYAFTVGDMLTKARAAAATRTAGNRKEVDGQVSELLSEGIAHHLAFLNFLPFATVPAKGSSGSKGSGEGRARAKVLDVELDVEAARQLEEFERARPAAREARLKAEKAAEDLLTVRESPDQTEARRARAKEAADLAKRAQLERAREGLWGLFSMEAAVRSADLDRVVAPTRTKEHAARLETLQKLTTKVQLLLAGFQMPVVESPTTGKKRRLSQNPKRGSDIDDFSVDVVAMLETATELQQAADLPYDEVKPLATELILALDRMQSITGKVKAADAANFDEHQAKLKTMSAELSRQITRLRTDPREARENSARLLAHLLHDHQSAVARAYPHAVEQTGFLGEQPEHAKVIAAQQVLSFITDDETGIPGIEDGPARELADEVVARYEELGDPPVPGEKTRWVSDSATASLIAAFRGADVSIQGRPAAPPGVGGMGSHTTAWVTEVGWVRRKLAETGSKEALAAELQRVANAELHGDLMTELARHLPAEQLAAGQLGMIFDAASDVLAAEDPADVVTAYLSFRNLLPYATVDAGNRGGQAERQGAAKDVLFDGGSLRAAIEQKLGELSAERIEDTVQALRDAATALERDLANTPEPEPADPAPGAEQPAPTWKSFPDMVEAITDTIAGLRAEADRLEDDDDPAAGVGDRIYGIRKQEHSTVYDYANS